MKPKVFCSTPSKAVHKNPDADEKYYWTKENGDLIPKHELSDLHVCNIVAKYGKKWLYENGHTTLVRRFEQLNEEHDFFKDVK